MARCFYPEVFLHVSGIGQERTINLLVLRNQSVRLPELENHRYGPEDARDA